ncbi:AMP-binding protein [Variovorax sp. LjRoot175]|uniref:AMP-dependent synthetase/ligase n=1 Tax=Variovorax sp. LjRoot175 TaxID=3342276 RepID=UPI003ECFB47C
MKPQTVPQWLLYNSRERAELVGHRYKQRGIWAEYSWRRIYEKVQGTAFGLLTLGIERGQTVMVIGENRPEIYWVEWAAMAIGAKTVTLYPDSSEDELRYVADDAEVVAIFAEDQEQVDKSLSALARCPRVRTIFYCEPGGLWDYRQPALQSLDAVTEGGQSLAREFPQRIEQEIERGQTDDIALLAYTSGTTGHPKGVITTHRALLDCAERLRRALEIRPHSEYLSYIPLSWVPEQWFGVTLGMSLPMRVSFAERPDQVQEAIRELAVDVIVLGPRQWENLASGVFSRMIDAGWLRRKWVDWALSAGKKVNLARIEGRESTPMARLANVVAEWSVLRGLRDQLGLKRVRVAITGGAAMSPDVVRLFAGMGIALRNIYACSEFGLVSAHTGAQYDPETIGRPLTEPTEWGEALQWRISDAGELQLRGGAGFTGYWRRPEKTAEKLDGDWYRTGDAVGRSPASELIYYDRIEHMSELRSGAKYPKQFIEVRLRFSPYIKEVLVIGGPQHDFVVALVNIDEVVFSRWAEQRNIGFTTFTDLSQRPEIVEQVAAEIRAVNAKLEPAARVLRFSNLPKELDADEGELTRTRKLKREFIEERYRDVIEALYAGISQLDVAIPVRYQDGRSGTLRAAMRLGTASPPAQDAPVRPPAPTLSTLEAQEVQ